ncbi:dachshund homolog 1-like isoform X2 [Amphiura filiformis]|uniref:dachshund homolog 1-like isoform X2 n=1 Tax=Amphiura filiformis TaxID=82378 RepID=UPI003B2125B3
MESSPPTQIPPSSVLYKLDKIAYSTPPPVSSDPANNECKLIDYRGTKIASFRICGETMICLPQAFELFLKHLVGGLHTVYTKLKRLNITPVVCNVEQVRILRGLGAIQPGVNRCKLLTCKEFDILYEDCTTASKGPGRPLKRSLPLSPTPPMYMLPKSAHLCSRPGRPPKRSLPLSLTPPMHMLPQLAHLDHLKKPKLENGTLASLKSMGLPHFNGFDGRLGTSPYLLTTHPALLATSQAMATSQANAITMAAAAAAASENYHSSSNLGSPNGKASSLSGDTPGSDISASPRSDGSDGSGSARDSPPRELTHEDIVERRDSEKRHREAMAAMEHSLGKLCKPFQLAKTLDEVTAMLVNSAHARSLEEARAREEAAARDEARAREEARTRDDSHNNTNHHSKTSHLRGTTHSNSALERLAASAANHHHHQTPTLTLDRGPSAAELLVSQGASSIETLLTNIQGLLKVATDNARQVDKQTNLERAELKLELLRERELREALEKQLIAEQKRLSIIQKRLKKEKKAKRRLQDQVEGRPVQNGSPEPESMAKQSPADHLRALNESLSQELEMERNARNAEMERNARNAEIDRNGRSEHERTVINAEIDRNGRSHEYERPSEYERHGREMVHSPELDRHGRSMELENSRVARNGSMERDHPRHEVARSVGSDTERIQPLRNEQERKIPEHWEDLHMRREEMPIMKRDTASASP